MAAFDPTGYRPSGASDDATEYVRFIDTLREEYLTKIIAICKEFLQKPENAGVTGLEIATLLKEWLEVQFVEVDKERFMDPFELEMQFFPGGPDDPGSSMIWYRRRDGQDLRPLHTRLNSDTTIYNLVKK